MGGLALALGLGSSIYSAIKSKQAADAARKKEAEDKALLETNRANDEALFNLQYFQNFMDRTEMQDMLRVLNENDERQRNADLAAAAITGATPEQALAASEARGKQRADTMAGMARNASVLKDSYASNYQNQEDNYLRGMLGVGNVEQQILQNQAGQLSTAGGNLFTTGANIFSKPQTA